AGARSPFHVALEPRALGAREMDPAVRLPQSVAPGKKLSWTENEVAPASPGLLRPLNASLPAGRRAGHAVQAQLSPGRARTRETNEEPRLVSREVEMAVGGDVRDGHARRLVEERRLLHDFSVAGLRKRLTSILGKRRVEPDRALSRQRNRHDDPSSRLDRPVFEPEGDVAPPVLDSENGGLGSHPPVQAVDETGGKRARATGEPQREPG